MGGGQRLTPMTGCTIELVTFDLDDTLVDTYATVPTRARHALAAGIGALGLNLSSKQREALVTGVTMGDPDERPLSLLRDLGLERDEPAGRLVLEAYGEHTLALLEPMDGAAEILSHVSSRCAVAVITNGPDELQRAKLRASGLGALVELVFTSGGTGIAKPDPRIFHLACERTGVAPERAAHVGDSPHADVAGARAAGFAAIRFLSAVPYRDEERAPRADATIRALGELPGLLGLPPVPTAHR